MKTTAAHPMPISRRLAPVMFARASEHGDAAPGSPAGHAGPKRRTDWPPRHAKTKSTAYSGNTAIKARTASERPAEMSSCATSAAHDSRNAAPTIPTPKQSASTGYGSAEPVKRRRNAGTLARNASTTTTR